MRSLVMTMFVVLIASAAMAAEPVELVFCVDGTKGMKKTLKALRKSLPEIDQACTAKLRYGVVAYRNTTAEQGKGKLSLTANVKGVTAVLRLLGRSNGVGTAPALAQALEKAVKGMAWRAKRRLIVLLGKSAADLTTEVKRTCIRAARDAKKAGIVILALAGHGMDEQGRELWKELARLAGGEAVDLPTPSTRRLVVPVDCGSSCEGCTLPCAMNAAPGNQEVSSTTEPDLQEVLRDAITVHVSLLASP